MKIFFVDSDKVMNDINVRDWVLNMLEKGILMGSDVKAVIARHTIHQSVQPDGTQLDVMYINSDNDALLINYQGDEIIQGNLLVGYTPAFGNPLPFIKRIVISMDGLRSFDRLASISVTTDYLAVEEEVERLLAQGDKSNKSAKPAKKVSVKCDAKPKVKKCLSATDTSTINSTQGSLF